MKCLVAPASRASTSAITVLAVHAPRLYLTSGPLFKFEVLERGVFVGLPHLLANGLTVKIRPPNANYG